MESKSKGAALLGWATAASLCLILMPFTVTAVVDAGNNADGGETRQELYVKVHFKAPVKLSALKPGDTVEGALSEGVYSGDREVFPAGSRVRLTVDRLERARKAPNDHWPWVIKVFAPRHENRPVFTAASVFLPDGKEVPLSVSLISIGDKRDVHVQWRTQKTGGSSNGTRLPSGGPAPAAQPSPLNNATGRKAHAPGTTATFEAVEMTSGDGRGTAAGQVGPGPARLPDQARIEAGTQARVILLGEVSASRSHPGDVISARTVEPIRLGSTVVLPQGSVFEGKVVRVTRPRWLSRSGSLLLAFDRLTLPGGAGAPVAASITGAELDTTSHTKIDPEGNLRGDRPGKVWMLINLGTSLGISKVVDDSTQLVIELIVSTATDASTAGLARIVAACISGVFMITRHGRDVVLPKFTEMRIVLDEPVSLPGPQSGQARVGNQPGGNP
jgi:hypothetical protein